MRKYTVRGTLRLTKKQRSVKAKRVWRLRRAEGTAPPKLPKRKPDRVRSEAMKRSWRRRRAAGKIVKKPKKPLLSTAKRRKISRAAAALRLQRAPEQRRKDRKLLGLPPSATAAEIRAAFDEARERLGMQRATWAEVRRALMAEQQAVKKRKQMSPRKKKRFEPAASVHSMAA